MTDSVDTAPSGLGPALAAVLADYPAYVGAGLRLTLAVTEKGLDDPTLPLRGWHLERTDSLVTFTVVTSHRLVRYEANTEGRWMGIWVPLERVSRVVAAPSGPGLSVTVELDADRSTLEASAGEGTWSATLLRSGYELTAETEADTARLAGVLAALCSQDRW